MKSDESWGIFLPRGVETSLGVIGVAIAALKWIGCG